MLILSALFTQLTGPLLKWITIPLLCLAALTATKVAWDKRDARLLRQGEMVCNTRWEAAVRAEEQRSAAERHALLLGQVKAERDSREGLQDELNEAMRVIASLRAGAGTDPRCLSDGVLDALRKGGGAKGRRPGS